MGWCVCVSLYVVGSFVFLVLVLFFGCVFFLFGGLFFLWVFWFFFFFFFFFFSFLRIRKR